MRQPTPLSGIAVVGPRLRDEVDEANNIIFIKDIILPFLEKKYGKDFYLMTVGCDKGFGKDLYKYCKNNKVKFVQVEAYLHGLGLDDTGMRLPFGSTEDCNKVYMSRFATLLDIGVEFFIKVSTRRTMVNDLVERVKLGVKPYYLYTEENECCEYREDGTSVQKEEAR